MSALVEPVATEAPARAAPLLQVNDLTKHFPLGSGLFGRSAGVVRAVDGVSFELAAGETLGIVGESGCGKSTTARLLVDLIRPDSGQIILEGQQVGPEMSIREMRRRMQMVFQDSYASLNPRLTMEDAIAFGPARQRHAAAKDAGARARIARQGGARAAPLRRPLSP